MPPDFKNRESADPARRDFATSSGPSSSNVKKSRSKLALGTVLILMIAAGALMILAGSIFLLVGGESNEKTPTSREAAQIEDGASNSDPALSGSDAARSMDDIEPVVALYQKQVEEANAKMSSSFDALIQRARKDTALRSDDLQVVVDRLQTEKEAFDKAGYLPFSAPGLTLWPEYVKAIGAAESRVREAFDRQIATALQEKRDANADILAKERDRILPPRIIAVWNDWKMLSNKQITRPGSKAGTWEMSKNVITVRWPASGDQKLTIDKCTVNKLGDAIEYKNQWGRIFRLSWKGPAEL
jgi:hypothetical protein